MRFQVSSIQLLVLTGLLFLILSCSKQGEDNATQVSILIKDAQIIDGSGALPFHGDLWIIDDTIAGVGDAPAGIQARQTIDASGMVLAPGFIDLHAHGNPSDSTGFKNFIFQGVTTICLGMDGFSPAGLDNWISDSVDTGLPLNMVFFTGHSSIRMESGIEYQDNPSIDALKRMSGLLETSLTNGSFGLSLGLEYRPGGMAGVEELRMLAETSGHEKGLIMSHVRNEDDDQIDASINELLELGIFTPVHISHIKVVYGKGSGRADQILDLLDSARERGVHVTADIYPYTASYTGIGILFPDWAKPPVDYKTIRAKRRKELRDYLLARVEKRNGPEATLIGTGKWKGMDLKEIEEAESRHWVDILIDDIGPGGASGAYFIMDEELQSRLLADPRIAIASDGSPTMNHPRGYGTFAKVIRKYVREESLLTMEEAIRKMTSLPAKILKLKDRGKIEAGMKADLILFDPLKFSDRATYEDPHQYAEGLVVVVIGGEVVLGKGAMISHGSGRLLKK